MLVSRMLRLTNITSPLLNDLKEPKEFGDKEAWRRLCIACFSTRSEDSNPMWGLYGYPADEAICITIPASMVKKISGLGRCYVEKKSNTQLTWHDVDRPQKVSECYSPLKGKSILTHHDVAYYSNLYRREDDGSIVLKLFRREECVAELDLSRSGNAALRELTGYAKRREWEYEDESRLRLRVPPMYEKRNVYVELPGGFFNAIRITLGPSFDIWKRHLYKMPEASAKDVLDWFLRQRDEKKVFAAIKTSGYSGMLQYSVMKNGVGVIPKNVKGNKRVAKKAVLKFHDKNVIRECRNASSIYKQLFILLNNRG